MYFKMVKILFEMRFFDVHSEWFILWWTRCRCRTRILIVIWLWVLYRWLNLSRSHPRLLPFISVFRLWKSRKFKVSHYGNCGILLVIFFPDDVLLSTVVLLGLISSFVVLKHVLVNNVLFLKGTLVVLCFGGFYFGALFGSSFQESS